MPTKIKLKVFEARDLPIMDQSNQTTDAYVEVKLSDIYNEKTEIVHKTLNPVWNQEFILEVSHDGDILKHPLELKVWDRDTISSDDVIGGVLIDLSNLLLNEATEIIGWFPIYDTMRGARGELRLSVSLVFFGKMSGTGIDSTASVMFAYGPIAPPNMYITHILGFVEELLVDDDPEYNWKEAFRSSRNSNEARQYVLYKLSSKIRREIGAKVLGLGGNAVIGFKKHIEFENQGSIVMRGYGTAVTLKKMKSIGNISNSLNMSLQNLNIQNNMLLGSPGLTGSTDEETYNSNLNNQLNPINTSSKLATLIEGNLESSISGSYPDIPNPIDQSTQTSQALPIQAELKASSSIAIPSQQIQQQYQQQQQQMNTLTGKDLHFSVLKMHAGDIQLLTISQFPPPTVVRISGVVTARSIKLIPKNMSEEKARTTRDKWWTELRNEVKSHARFLSCSYVIGYKESTTSYDDMILLTASGTAVNLKVLASSVTPSNLSVVDNLPGVAETTNNLFNQPLTDPINPSNPISDIASPTVCVSSTPRGGLTTSTNISTNQSSEINQTQFGVSSSPMKPSSVPQGSFLLNHFGNMSSAAPSTTEVTPEQKQFIHNACGSCHIPYKAEKAPYKLKLVPCNLCGLKTVPEILLATIEPPPGIAIIGQGQMIDAYASRPKKKSSAEGSAAQLSEAIPFLEYDLYSQLMNKLKILGMNSCFKMQTKFTVGDNLIIAHTQATAICLAALPRPEPLKPKQGDMTPRAKNLHGQLVKSSLENSRNLIWSSADGSAPSSLTATVSPLNFEPYPDPHLPVLFTSRPIYQKMGSFSFEGPSGHSWNPADQNSSNYPLLPSSEDLVDENVTIEDSFRFSNTKEAKNTEVTPSYLVELENDLDEDLMALIASDPVFPNEFKMANTQQLPGTKPNNWSNMQLITVVRTVEWNPTKQHSQLTKLFATVFHTLYSHLSFRMHLIRPCAIVGVKVDIQIPDGDEVQLTFTGMALHSAQSLRIAQTPVKLNPITSSAPSNTTSTSTTPRKKSKKVKDTGDDTSTSVAPSTTDIASTDDKDANDELRKSKKKKLRQMSSSEQVTKQEEKDSSAKEAPKLAESPAKSSPTSPRKEKSSTRELKELVETKEFALPSIPPPQPTPLIPTFMTHKPTYGIQAFSTPDVPHVEITPLSYVPGSVMEKFMGTVHLSFIKETFSLTQTHGISVFTQNLVLEAQRIARAHVLALGANVLASYNMEMTQRYKVLKNQAYCLLTITGDALLVTPTASSSTGYKKLAKAQTLLQSKFN